MHEGKETICQYLKGSPDGAQCGIVDKLVRCMEGADIRLCMSRRYEACSYYVVSLLRQVSQTAADPDTAMGSAA